MTIQEVIAAQIAANQQQLAAYQADIQNILNLVNTLNTNTQVLITWLAANPG